MSDIWPWLTLFGLGAYHGINPGMGWLFAVALGLQEKSRRAVFKALAPITLGHALSIALIVSVLVLATAFRFSNLRIPAAIALMAFGTYRLIRARHPR